MKKILVTLLGLVVCVSGFSQETRDSRCARLGRSAGYASQDATVLSMVGWGFGIAIGIALISSLIDEKASASSSSSSH